MTTTTTTNANGTTAPATSAAIVRHEDATIQPAGFAELRALAKDAAESNFFGAKSPQQALMVMMAGKDLGLSYTQALRMFHVIEGKPSLSAAGMVAVCVGHPEICEYVTTIENTEERATVEVKRVGKAPKRATFTMADAQRAKLVKPGSGWEKYPSRMLLARARSFACHEEFEDLLAGLYDPDELRDTSEPRRVEATPVAPASSPAVDVTSAAQAFADAIGRASSPAEMKAISSAIADANLGEVDVAHLKAVYQARVAEMKKAGAK